ncbi:DnaJ domain containing protein [Achlya hypogyna]|uniref:DnaJ domain containing protein n=1 Tax=Achlya hypogyna TaxID=1202772 RepID=A0A1V9YLC5_ACHHY|nr:DnaJ domain containing protein [Achlya hypogyna]
MRCHYDVLGVARDITAADLRKAFFKLALKWHPDKIKADQDVEEATQIFQEIQSAYEVLSDPQERQWYDDHREQILRGDDGTDHTTEEDPLDIMRYFSTTVYKGFKDDAGGFYAIYRALFEQIDALDMEARGDKRAAPSFGGASADAATDVMAFYNYWRAYSTDRSFSWLDTYKTTDAPTREIRRLMEKDNKKLRDAGKKAFSANVRALVDFVRKRDRRVAKHLKELEQQKEAAAKEKEAAAQEKRRAFEAEKASFQATWEVDAVHSHVEAQVRAEVAKLQAKQEAMILVCELCKKEFKSEKQVENHLKSKKHRDQMLASGLDPSMLDELLELEGQSASPAAAPEEPKKPAKEPKASKAPAETDAKRLEREDKERKAAEKRAERKEKRKSSKKDEPKKADAPPTRPVAANDDDDDFPCGSCSMVFPTLKMLQKHTKKEGHTEPVRRK